MKTLRPGVNPLCANAILVDLNNNSFLFISAQTSLKQQHKGSFESNLKLEYIYYFLTENKYSGLITKHPGL